MANDNAHNMNLAIRTAAGKLPATETNDDSADMNILIRRAARAPLPSRHQRLDMSSWIRLMSGRIGIRVSDDTDSTATVPGAER